MSSHDSPPMFHPAERPVIRELHIDAHAISPEHVAALRALGFEEDCFTAAGGGLERPANHFTWEISGTSRETARMRRIAFVGASAALSRIPGFHGYIESEVIPSEFQVSFRRRPFAERFRFDLNRIQQERTAQNKRADLHIKVPLALASQALEAEFSRLGMYYVETPKANRIYTLQFHTHTEARAAFAFFSKAVSDSGGVVELTYEICDAFVRVPQDIFAPTIVERGGFFRAMDVPTRR